MRRRRFGRNGSDRRGATLMLMIVVLPVIVILSAFAINIAYMELVRTELRISSDAATRAGGRRLILSNDQALAKAEARDAASRNLVAGQSLLLADDDFEFGFASRTAANVRYTFDPTSPDKNALRLTGDRTDGSLSGPVTLLMPVGSSSVTTMKVEQRATSTQVEIDIALVLDRSGSMAYAANEPAVHPPNPAAAPTDWDFCDAAPPTARWRDLVGAVDAFLAQLALSPQIEPTAVITYSDNVTTDLPITTDYAQASTAMDVHTQQFCGGNTNVGGGILAGINALKAPGARPWAAKAIIVMTDGIHNTGTDPMTAATQAANDGIMVFTVTFSDEADQAAMKAVAKKANGEHYHATDSNGLVVAFEEIARKLPSLLTE